MIESALRPGVPGWLSVLGCDVLLLNLYEPNFAIPRAPCLALYWLLDWVLRLKLDLERTLLLGVRCFAADCMATPLISTLLPKMPGPAACY